ncbi:helix-turn-helix domain-containing protein [Streptomyces sp. NPDC005181]|uniref:helix-turn-helix transcriptional regulator n=1 Tax=Streptomyces sp. NPDC005181 TaxID=3156869 RepID=UPI0033B40CA2
MVRYLTTAEVAERYRTADSTVRYWRQIGKGPRGIKVGKRVLYPEAELLRYEEALTGGQDEWGTAA